MSADFTPSFGVYKETGSFKFWCQKVLPLVYDDSLSYYETLCKVVKYLNDVIANVDVLHDDVDGLRNAYIQLQNYVNSYFDNLDVQNEINQKLDDMADDGTLSALLSPIVATQIGGVVGEQIDAVVGEQIDASVGRQIDESVASQIGTPTATATTAWLNEHVNPVGSAVVVDDTLTIEGAAADAKVCGDEFSRLNNALTSLYKIDNTAELYEGDTIYLNGYAITHNSTKTEWTINRVVNYKQWTFAPASGYKVVVTMMDSNDIILGSSGWVTSPFTILATTYKVLAVLKKTDNTAISDSAEAYNAITISMPIENVKSKADEMMIVGGSKSYDFTSQLSTGKTRIRINVITKYSNVIISCNSASYYFFVEVYDENNTVIYDSTTWKVNTSFTAERAYKVRVTLKIGSAGSTTFTDADLTAIESALSITEVYPSLILTDAVYVDDTNGNDTTGKGTASSPYKTLSKAVSVSKNIIINPGTYTDSVSITGKDDVCIMANPIKTNNTDKVVISTSSAHVLVIEKCNHVLIEGIVFDGANESVVQVIQCGDVLIQGCEFNNSVTQNGISFAKSDGRIIDCRADNNYNDGFNIQSYGDTCFINCSAKGNHGDGISHHDSCTGSVIGGYWENNQKAGISTPTYGAKVNVSDAICIGNKYGMQVYGGEYVTENTVHIKVSNVIFLNNTTSALQVDKYIVDLVNCMFSGNTANFDVVSGTINQYIASAVTP